MTTPPTTEEPRPDPKAIARRGFGQALAVGTNFAAGMALFAFLGYRLDQRRGGGVFYTVCGMFLGLLYGAYEVWKAVRLLDANYEESRKTKAEKGSRPGVLGNTRRTWATMNAGNDRVDAVLAFIMHHVEDTHDATPFPGLRLHLPAYLSWQALMVVLAAGLLVVLFGGFYRKQDAVPHGLTNILELFVLFVRDQICVPYLGDQDGRRMAPLFCSFFFFILTMNLVGLVPCFSAATSNINVTGALAAVTMSFMIFGSILRTGVLGFIKGFIPPGVPWPLLILLIPTEIASLLIKSGALAIRLFANELAGHLVVLSLLGLVLMFGYVAVVPAVIMAVGVDILEVGIAFLQAYIFTLLSAVFIGQRYHPAH